MWSLGTCISTYQPCIFFDKVQPRLCGCPGRVWAPAGIQTLQVSATYSGPRTTRPAAAQLPALAYEGEKLHRRGKGCKELGGWAKGAAEAARLALPL